MYLNLFGKEKSFEIYKVKELEPKQFLPKESILLEIELQAASTKLFHQRSIYNVLDFLGDIGGLLDALKLIASTIVGLLMNRSLSNHIISQLFYLLPNSSKHRKRTSE